MTKSFFIVVPYSPAILQSNKNSMNPFKKRSSAMVEKGESEQYEENKAQIEERISVVEQGLTRCGIRVVGLGTEEIVELFYKLFNPGDTEKPIKLTS